jgi:uncharacterized protein (DUF1800 family)
MAQRFGYGPAGGGEGYSSADEILQGLGVARPVADFANQELVAQRLDEYGALRKKYRDESLPEEERTRYRKEFTQWRSAIYLTDAHRRVAAAVSSASAFFDRLVSFWSNHFTISIQKVDIMPIAGLFEDMAIRPHVAGRFEDMLLAVEFHPAMMMYLDLINSIGPNSALGKKSSKGLNENLAREILELHTMGVNGGYSQRDVTEFAKIMTGWIVDPVSRQAAFRRFRAEPGSKMFLGQKFGGPKLDEGDYAKALRMAANHPSTALHIARKLIRHFISEDITQTSAERVAEAFTSSSGELLPTYRALLELPEAQALPLQKARTDFDFVVSALRAANISAETIKPRVKEERVQPQAVSVGSLMRMQQRIWSASSPAGWPERPDEWLGPAALAERLDFISRIVPHIRDAKPDMFLERALGSLASEQTRHVVSISSSREEGIALVMASPEFNRR